MLQYGLLHCNGIQIRPNYKLTYLDVHRSLLQTFPDTARFITPCFTSKDVPRPIFCSNVQCSQFLLAYATKDANMEVSDGFLSLFKLDFKEIRDGQKKLEISNNNLLSFIFLSTTLCHYFTSLFNWTNNNFISILLSLKSMQQLFFEVLLSILMQQLFL